MVSQIDELRKYYNNLDNVKQKKQFIDNLKVKLQGNTNKEYQVFLNECVKNYNSEISTKNDTLSKSDFNDLTRVSSGLYSADEAFENRVEEYKENGYILTKRKENSVFLMTKANKKQIIIMFIIAILFAMIFIPITFMCSVLVRMLLGVIMGASIPIFTNFYIKYNNGVELTITRTGKIEEKGNVLKE